MANNDQFTSDVVSLHPKFSEAIENAAQAAVDRRALRQGGSPPTFPGMDPDVAVLKYRAEQTDARFEKIDQKLDKLIERMAELPTRRDLWAWKWQWTALAVGTIAVVVGGIIGGLSWIKPDGPAPQPIIIQTAPQQASPPTAKP